MPSRSELANAIRFLSMDSVQKSKSGHPGAPMGMAEMAQVLWCDLLQHNPADPNWFNRDRFVLSNGHASMLLYSLLHLTGYDLTIEDLKNFRQFDSRTPGHPELGYTPGVETTTGPLGQGITNAVGFAIAEQVLAAQFNRPGYPLVNHHTYVFLGDGCLMEGISHEACSLAGTLGLGKLIALYDDNGISIDGEVDGWFTDDTVKRFEAYGWQVIGGIDGHDPEALTQALQQAQADTGRPSLLCCKTVIGKGAPTMQGTHDVHGAPLGDKEIQACRDSLGWSHAAFEIPADIYQAFDCKTKGATAQAEWQKLLTAYQAAFPELAVEFQRRIGAELPADWAAKSQAYIEATQAKAEKIASRKASQNALNAYGPLLPELLGGSADLAGSNLTLWSGSLGVSSSSPQGNYLHYGVREFAMTAIMNGIALHGGFIPYGGTFLVFMDYARNAVRMAALMKQRVILVYTHDSIGLGEDGPTHQPIEHLASLRLIPNMRTWRPADATETAVAWAQAIERTDGPSSLVFSRQNLAPQARSAEQLQQIARGGYVLVDCDTAPELILMGTGSELDLAVQAAERLAQQGRKVRVVSMPCTEAFDAQDAAYRESVLPANCRQRIAVEAASADFWYKYVGFDGRILGMTSFGESAPAEILFKHYGFSVERLLELSQELLG